MASGCACVPRTAVTVFYGLQSCKTHGGKLARNAIDGSPTHAFRRLRQPAIDRPLEAIEPSLIFNHIFQPRHIQYVQLMLFTYHEPGAGQVVQFARYCFTMGT